MSNTKPQRIRYDRYRGMVAVNDLPCINVCHRDSKWASPFRAGQTNTLTAEDAVDAYRVRILSRPHLIEAARRELAGKNLACWCALGKPCHADTLLEIANAPAGTIFKRCPKD